MNDVPLSSPPVPFALLQTVKTDGLPACRVLWLSETALVTAGHNVVPDVFARAGDGSWAFVASADVRDDAAAAAAAGGRAASAFGTARAVFVANKAVNSGAGAAKGRHAAHGPASGGEQWTKHQSAITDMRAYTTTGAWLSCCRLAVDFAFPLSF